MKIKNYPHIIILILILFVAGCKSKTIYVPVESVKTEYRERLLRDSIQVYDSVFVREKGDTVRIEKYRYIYKDKLKTDTICISDTIRVPYPVVETKEVNRLHNWQITLMCLGGVLIGYSGFRLIRRFL